MKTLTPWIFLTFPLVSIIGQAATSTDHASETSLTIAEQRQKLAANTSGHGFGPQSPRDLDTIKGSNPIIFGQSPKAEQMNLCNIHFHKNAEHKGGEFTQFAGEGDGHGYQTGYQYSGKFKQSELTPYPHQVGSPDHPEDNLHSGDTIEVHFVYTTASVTPGPTLGACLSEDNSNPQLRVEAQVMALVNDDKAANFLDLTKVQTQNARPQAVNLPTDTGTPIVYLGSTTGPNYNEKASPFQVTWSVRPKVKKVNIASVDTWLKDNIFKEDHAHGVRNLVTNISLLSTIDQ